MPSVNFGRGSSVAAPSRRQRPSVSSSRTALRLLERGATGSVPMAFVQSASQTGISLLREGLARAVLDLGDERPRRVVGRFCVPLCVMVRCCLILGCCGSLWCPSARARRRRRCHRRTAPPSRPLRRRRGLMFLVLLCMLWCRGVVVGVVGMVSGCVSCQWTLPDRGALGRSWKLFGCSWKLLDVPGCAGCKKNEVNKKKKETTWTDAKKTKRH